MKLNIKNEKVKVIVQTYGRVAAAIVLIIIICVMLATLTDATGNTNKETAISENTTENKSELTSAEMETVISELQKDAYPEIQELMEKYFEAKINCDVAALGQIVYPVEGYTVEGLENDLGIPESEAFRRVEDYQNVVCYTKPGLLPDTYVVWVYYETKYVNVATAAPCMFKAYICTDDTGVYIYNGAIEGEISNYLDEVSQDEDVVALVNSVNQQLSEACNHDAALMHIYEILWGVSEVPETTTTAE